MLERYKIHFYYKTGHKLSGIFIEIYIPKIFVLIHRKIIILNSVGLYLSSPNDM